MEPASSLDQRVSHAHRANLETGSRNKPGISRKEVSKKQTTNQEARLRGKLEVKIKR